MIDIKYYRKLKYVNRLSQMYKTREYSLFDHQYMVLVLFRRFASLEDISYDMNVLDIVMHHDMLEVISTDLPHPIKNISPEAKKNWIAIEKEIVKKNFQFEKYTDDSINTNLTARQFALFKACDVLDLWIFCKEEQEFGNSSKEIQEVILTCESIINSLDFTFPRIIKYMKEYTVNS